IAYKPIESYGVIGDLHTVALVGMDGSIDWCCLPHFDSPSIFGAILDERKGGYFKRASLYEPQHKQMYLPDSNVLVTRFLSPEGVGEVVDFMPVQDPSRGKKTHHIVRVVRAVRGAVRFRLECQPAFDYARRPHQITLEGRGAVFEAPGMRFSLVSRFPLARQGTGVVTEFLLHPGEPSTFILRQVEGDGDAGLMEARLVGTELLTQTLEFWRRWLSKCRYDGRWREMVNRSALMLKLLTFAPTGAIVAAPTCSLPEEIGVPDEDVPHQRLRLHRHPRLRAQLPDPGADPAGRRSRASVRSRHGMRHARAQGRGEHIPLERTDGKDSAGRAP